MEETDEILYEKYLKSDDQSAFAVVYDHHHESLTFFLYTMVGNMEDAEELMLDAFAVAASKTAKFTGRGGAAFKTWLYGIAKNKAKMHLRRKKAITVPLSEEIITEEGLPEEKTIEKERDKKLYQSLSDIHKDYREALYLMYFEQMSIDEIATVMKKSKKQIYNLVARGKQALKEALERKGIYELYYDF